ncbi:MAG: GNAT family N-acetyltransferase [Candidatus Rifleibacteriota bacterium]
MQFLIRELMRREKYFVEEIDRLLFAPEKVELFPGPPKRTEKTSWIYMAGDSDSADWNLARCLTEPEIAKKYIHFLPANETQLLVEKSDETEFAEFNKKGEIFWFESIGQIETGLANYKKQAAEQNWFKKSELKTKDNIGWFNNCKRLNAKLFFLNKDSMLGVIKTIKETPGYAEVYIEVRPDFQGKGIGTLLLLEMINLLQKSGKQLIYSVESDNQASIRIAQKANLKKFNVLSRFAAE